VYNLATKLLVGMFPVAFDVPERTTPVGEIVSPLAEEDEESDTEPSMWTDSRLTIAVTGAGTGTVAEFELTTGAGPSELIPCVRKPADSSNGSLLPLELRGGCDS
jgi:hypothetical protein